MVGKRSERLEGAVRFSSSCITVKVMVADISDQYRHVRRARQIARHYYVMATRLRLTNSGLANDLVDFAWVDRRSATIQDWTGDVFKGGESRTSAIWRSIEVDVGE